jgi:hypothetical protein
MKGLALFLISLISVSLVFALSTTYSIIYHIVCFWKVGSAYQKISRYFYQMAISIDQFGNVNCAPLFNRIMISKKWRTAPKRPLMIYEPFGDEDDTISYVLAKNNKANTLSPFGKFWGRFLNKVDNDHLSKALINKNRRDREACHRIGGEYEK